MSQINLSIATNDYDHFRDVRIRKLSPEGIDLNWFIFTHHECFARFTADREFDISELSFAKFSTQITRDKPDIIGLPIVCSRLFRFSSFYINKNSGIKTVEDLKGKRVGSPEWAHSAAVWMRGWMQNDKDIDLTDISWVQAGANAPGREEKVELNLPEGINLERVKDKSLSQLLACGDIDCAIIARPPTCFLENHPDIIRLFPDYIKMEEVYYKETGIWPIMHILAMKRSIHDEHPWIARNLYNVFLEAKDQSVSRLLDPAISRYPLPWLATYARDMRDLMNGDPFPYGVEENRKTWEQMALYSYQQGIAHRQFTPEEIFPSSVSTKVII